jgi:serine protease Do
MMNRAYFTGAAIGAVATVLVGAGGYWAGAKADAPVNTPMTAPAAGAPASFADIVQRVSPAVVSIDVEGKSKPGSVTFQGQAPPPSFFQGLPGDGGDGGADNPFGFDLRRFFQQQAPDAGAPTKVRATGSGFFVSADGYIVTNNHVIDGADEITVRTKDDRKLTAHVIGRDPATDLAVIKVDGGDFPFVSFEDRAKPRVGDWVVAVGNPYGLGGTATAGIVSALARKNVSDSNYVDYMQIDAPINRGNSGGPTFDVYGRVVGVNTAIFSPSGGSVGIGFDIPADVAGSVTHQLIADGKVVRGYIGATIQDVTPEIADSLGLSAAKGALIADLANGGPAQRAGLQSGDVVVKIDGRDVVSASDLTRQVALVRPGEALNFDVRRDGKMLPISIRSGLRPAQPQLASYDGQGGGAASEGQVLGMRLEPNPDSGLTIDGVSANSDAAEKGLHQGDVILQANGRVVAKSSDLNTVVSEARRAHRKDVLLLVAHNGNRGFVPLSLGDSKG